MLTERKIRDTKPGPKAIMLRDRELSGFAVRVAPGGVKSYVLDYRVNGRRRLATLARCSEISLKDARAMAGRELVAIRSGETDPLERRREAREAPTVADLVERFLTEYAPRRIDQGRLSPTTLREYRRQAKGTIVPAIGKRRVADVTRADVERAVAKCAPVERNRQISFVRRLFNLAEDWEMREPGTNPARRIDTAREEARDRVFSPSEIAALGAALSEVDNPIVASLIRFLILTGWRNGEALALRWDDVDFETGEIVLPSTKTGRSVRTVGAGALDILASLPKINGNPYCFAGAKSAAVSYKTLHKAFKTACARAGIADARLHDCRRTLATRAAPTLTLTGLRDLLNHKTVTMAARYARRSDDLLRAAQNDMADQMAAMMDGESGDVVELKRG